MVLDHVTYSNNTYAHPHNSSKIFSSHKVNSTVFQHQVI